MGNANTYDGYCKHFTEVLKKCFPGQNYSLTIGSWQYPGYNQVRDVKAKLTLKADGRELAYVYLTVFDVDDYAYEFLRLVKSPDLLPRPVKIGQIDSNTRIDESSGYNRLLRTIGYNMMYDVGKCRIMATYAINAVSLHILSKYFHWDFEAGEETMVDYKQNQEEEEEEDNMPIQELANVYSPGSERRRANIRQLVANSEPAGSLMREIRRVLYPKSGFPYNACVDLTDPKKLEAMRFMLNQVLQCKCPPCQTALDPPKKEKEKKQADQKTLVYRKRRLARGKPKARLRTIALPTRKRRRSAV